MLIDVMFRVYLNAIWNLDVETNFQCSKQNQWNWEQEVQIEISCVITFGDQTIPRAKKTNIFSTS